MEFVSAYEIRKNRTIEEATEENDTPHKIPEGSTPLEELGKLLELKGAVRPYVTGEGPFLMLPIPGEKDGAVMLELGSRKEGTVSLDYINVVEELRGKGYAGDALDVIGGIADDFEFPIYLTIDDRATPRAVLEKFYKKHGFVEVDEGEAHLGDMVRRPEHRPVQTDEKDRRHQQRGGVMEDKDVRRIVKDLRRATKWLKVVEDLVADRLTKADRKSLASAIRRADQSLMKAGVGEEE